MSKILAYLRFLFSDDPHIKGEEPEGTMTLDVDERPFWENLPSLGDDQDVRIEAIKRVHPVHALNHDPYVLRRKLYKSLLSLRTESKRGWINDDKVEKIKFA